MKKEVRILRLKSIFELVGIPIKLELYRYYSIDFVLLNILHLVFDEKLT